MKINDYPQVDTLQDEDLVLLDTAEGTRTQRVDKLAQNLQEKMTNMFNPTAFTTTNVIADTDYLITSSKDPDTEEVVNRKITALDAAEELKAKMDLDGNGSISKDDLTSMGIFNNTDTILGFRGETLRYFNPDDITNSVPLANAYNKFLSFPIYVFSAGSKEIFLNNFHKGTTFDVSYNARPFSIKLLGTSESSMYAIIEFPIIMAQDYIKGMKALYEDSESTITEILKAFLNEVGGLSLSPYANQAFYNSASGIAGSTKTINFQIVTGKMDPSLYLYLEQYTSHSLFNERILHQLGYSKMYTNNLAFPIMVKQNSSISYAIMCLTHKIYSMNEVITFCPNARIPLFVTLKKT